MFQSNSEFSIEVRKLINTFKRIWRQNKINFIQQGLDVKDFRISRKEMQHYNDGELFQVTRAMFDQLTAIINDENHELYAHKGLTIFTEELSVICNTYTLQNNTVTHAGKYASSILVTVLQQLSTLVNHSLSRDKQDELQQKTVLSIKKIKSLNHPGAIKQLMSSIDSIKNSHKDLYFFLSSYL